MVAEELEAHAHSLCLGVSLCSVAREEVGQAEINADDKNPRCGEPASGCIDLSWLSKSDLGIPLYVGHIVDFNRVLDGVAAFLSRCTLNLAASA